MAPRVLICLDLNGTLLDRLTDGDRIKRSRTNPKCPPIPDLVINGKKIYFRPYLDLFLEGLFRSFAVATWTSAMPKNADPMVTHLFPKKLRGKLQFNWTREKCEIMGSAREHQSIKDLAKMWADEEASSAGRWNERNTLIIDDSVGKGARNPFNAIHLVPFTVTEPDHLDCDTDSTLLSVINYLSHLVEWLEQDPDRDVRDFVRDNPLYVLEAFEAGMDSDGTETAQLEVAERYRATMEQIRDADAMRPRHRRDTEGFTRHWLQTQGARALEVDGDATQQWDKSHKDADLKKYKPSATVTL
ncbi:NLI interacting factor-like phosphatase-domain-containing protein [Hyaloraphidium curvatum]|nr:NLI interacting factor-like phosphatase-domain-containing protein [Hyaloraphidium curvatum]